MTTAVLIIDMQQRVSDRIAAARAAVKPGGDGPDGRACGPCAGRAAVR